MKKIGHLACLLLITIVYQVRAQDLTLPIIKSIPIRASLLQVDELGNAYLVKEDNTFVKFNERGDSIANYSSITNGSIAYVDVTNPLRIMVYHPRLAKLVLLDRMLAPKNELNLRQINLLNSDVVATSTEGNLWVYDQFSATLNKFDKQLNTMIQGNDLRQQFSELPRPSYLIERNRRVYMVDSAQGIFVFDQYGSYLNTLMILGLQKIQVVDDQLIYRKGSSLIAYDMVQIKESELKIPILAQKAIIDAVLNRNVLYVLYQDRLVYYQMAN